MINFLDETVEDIAESGHEPSDITFIGSTDSGHRCTWEEFCGLAVDLTYHNGFGMQEIASDLIIVFSDGSSMRRREYDGSEWWEFTKSFSIPEQNKPIKSLISQDGLATTLAELNP